MDLSNYMPSTDKIVRNAQAIPEKSTDIFGIIG